jgi:methyl-accepting chemotaxis protein
MAGDEPEEPTEEAPEDEEPVSELVEQLGRETSTLIFREAVLSASHHVPEVRRAARDVAVAVTATLALVTAFALANWAVVDALEPSLSGWRAPLVVAVFWLVVGIVLLLATLTRLGHLAGVRWWRDPAAARGDLEQARDEAEQTVRETLGRLSGAVAREAGAQIATAVVPFAGGVADAGEDILEAADDIIDAIQEEVPGGGAVRQVIDFVLLPGRFFIRVGTTVMKRD